VGRYEAYLKRLGVLDEATADQIRAEAADAMRAGIAAAEAEPVPDAELLFSNALADPPESFAADLAELRRILGDA
jgi:TPP-dependent pyruvate/acetoin dehydrogenase alpha subunit